jgi:diguanylate cyclase (GGDEF)-like protein
MNAAAPASMPIPVINLLEKRELQLVFQPIFEADGVRVHGYEALCRLPSRLNPAGPLDLFEAAAVAGVSSKLDLLLVELALQRHAALGLGGHLFINVLPQTLVAGDGLLQVIRPWLGDGGSKGTQLVLEITEHGMNVDPARLEANARPLRELGCQIAIDDLGAGASGLKAWSVLRPDIVKLDRYFAAQIGHDAVASEVLRSLLDIAHVMGSRVVAEGIESREQCAGLQALGVDYLQGYFLGVPEGIPRLAVPAPQIHVQPVRHTENCAEALLIERAAIGPETRVADAVAMLQRHADWDSIAVVEDGKPRGLVRRDQLLTLLSKPLHPELYNRKPVARVMDSEVVIVDGRARLEQVSRLVTGLRRARIDEDFLITRHGRYAGVGRTIDLLHQITSLQVEAATQCNPLTLLPGNREIDSHISRVLALRVPFAICHVDVDQFKTYNDTYGYHAGDQVLLHLADVLRGASNAAMDFVGHVGGDDFILILRSTDWERRLTSILETFGASVRNFYSVEHRARGAMPGVHRDGTPDLFPWMTLSLGVVVSDGLRYSSASEIFDPLQRAKSRAKAQHGDALIVL